MASGHNPRPQIGIERLPPRHTVSEQRELMNCKSCRKRKIKCNRLQPSCEACQVFGVPCIYDAVPKKRGPKTDVLEALLKRIDGLEKQLQPEDELPSSSGQREGSSKRAEIDIGSRHASRASSTPSRSDDIGERNKAASSSLGGGMTDTQSQEGWTLAIELDHVVDHLISTYFARLDGKPYYLLDESSLRASFQDSGITPHHLAMCALAARMSSLFGDQEQALLASNHYAMRARQILNADEPQLGNLMALLLLSQHANQSGQSKKAYMTLTVAVGMAFALDLHQELPRHAVVSPQERDVRRRVFWTCYLLDRFYSCGSKRPCLIPDECIILRLPSTIDMNGIFVESCFFMGATSVQYAGGYKSSQDAIGILVEVVKILGIAHRYLAAGGPKNDSHFPWHALSMLSKIRQELDVWAAETTEIFASLDIIFSHKDNTVLLLSKLIYHLVHCLIYRPFLPVDLVELSGTSQHQPWRVEATKLCFLHANTITELVEIWKAKIPIADFPAFAGYCISTAGSIHVHGSFYQSGEGQVFSQSQEFCSLELRQLADMRSGLAGAQHQLDTLQSIYLAHTELSRNFTSGAGRTLPLVTYDDFFDRYQVPIPNGAFINLAYNTPSEETSAPEGDDSSKPRQLDHGSKSERRYYQISYGIGASTRLDRKEGQTTMDGNKRHRESASKSRSHRGNLRSPNRPKTTTSLPVSPQTLGLHRTKSSTAAVMDSDGVSHNHPVPQPSTLHSRAQTLNASLHDHVLGTSIYHAASQQVYSSSHEPRLQQHLQQQEQEQHLPTTDDNSSLSLTSPPEVNMLQSATAIVNQDLFLSVPQQLSENEQSRAGLN